MTIVSQGVRVSKDDGKTWSETQKVCEKLGSLRGGEEAASASILRMNSGALVIVYLDSTTFKFNWDDASNQPKDDCMLEVWAIRPVAVVREFIILAHSVPGDPP